MSATTYIGIVVTLGVLAWLLRLWLQNTVQEAVKLGFAEELEETKLVLAKELELYKAQLKRHDVIGSIWWTGSRVIHQAPGAHSPESEWMAVGGRELRE